MDPLMVIMIKILNSFCLEKRWYLIMIKWLALMKAEFGLSVVKVLATIFRYLDVITLGIDFRRRLGSLDG